MVAGYEELTATQLMTIVWLLITAMWGYSIAIVTKSILYYRSIKTLEVTFKISNTVDKSIVEKWLEKRKKRKEDEMSTVLRGDGKSH